MRQVSEGIYQGDTSDLNSLKLEAVRAHYGITLAVNVGSTPFVPMGVPTLYVPMADITDRADPQRPLNKWPLIIDAAKMAAREIRRGGRVFINCDAGLSRSVVFTGLLIAVLQNIPMDENLLTMVRVAPGMEPSCALWDDATEALQAFK